MKLHTMLVLFVIFASIALLPSYSFASSSLNATVSANVVIGCPFALSMSLPSNSLTAIPKYGNYSINYVLNPIVKCTVPRMSGKLLIVSSNGSVAESEDNISVGQFNAPVNKTLEFNASELGIGNYSATLSFKNSQTENSITSAFAILTPANIVLENFTISSPVTSGSPVDFYVGLSNSGNYSASSIQLFINSTSPGSRTISSDIVNMAAYPSTENVVLSENGFADKPGTYTAYAYAEYKKSASGNYIKSNVLNFTYKVNSPSHSAPLPVTIPPTPIPKIPKANLTAVPLYLTGVPNTTVGTNIGISNPSNSSETVNFTVPSYLSSIVKLSENSITLSAGGTISISLKINSRNLSSGIYNIPINVTATIDNRTSVYTDYITYSVSGKEPNKPVISTAVELLNNTDDGYIIVSISTPSNVTITNGTAITYLPQGLVPNEDYMDAYGIPNNITERNGYYYVKWHISSLGPNQNIYAYIYVKKPSSQLLMSGIKTNVFIPTSSPASILRLLYVDSPTFKTYSNGTTEVELLYTGPYAENITFDLTGPYYMKIHNSSQKLLAVPNQVLYVYFNQVAGGIAGTSNEKLYITAPNAALNYSIGLIILPSPVSTTTSTTIRPNALVVALDSVGTIARKYFIVLVIITLAIILSFAYYSYNNKSHYEKGRMKNINEIKEQIKRNFNGKR